jgi:hypothetical protein
VERGVERGEERAKRHAGPEVDGSGAVLCDGAQT